MANGPLQSEDPETMTTCKRRKLCELGTGEKVHIVNYTSKADKIDEFEKVVQNMANCYYGLQSGITDIRVCHPRCGQVCFIITLLTAEDLTCFLNGPQKQAEMALEDLIEGDAPTFATSGCLMPAAHTLSSLLPWLIKNVQGTSHANHNVLAVQKEITRWYPRPSEYSKYIHWNPENSKAYTRNLIFGNEHMDVILMCWPAGSVSSIHDHDNSSCWVALVDGEVVEVQYAVPQLDRKFIETEMKNPTGAIGRCGKMKVISEAKLRSDLVTTTYANNDIALHRVENRTTKPAYTLHVYAPPLQKLKIFNETGEVHVHQVDSQPYDSVDGALNKPCCVDVKAWNDHQQTEY
eukprot:TRINITY_DN110_c0_g1_i1.p1 TRINITY_DN110_c0_g1~~TRINITY_DN110_c0_g1_i1.p1  ORF type:complete len:349 (+),score=71.02 TRINITY_DN110_c0_g1_i1:105-1151(+)